MPIPQIIPAIIAKNLDDLEEKMSNVRKLVPMVQVDVLDGSLVNLRSWPYQSPSKQDSFFDAIVREERGFPFWEDLEFEAHFMVREPEKIISDWITAGASRVIFQIEGVKDFGKCLKEVDGRVPVGASLALDTPHDALKPFVQDIAVIQCMGWNFSHLGRQGESLDNAVFEKIRMLRQDFPQHIISIDGGVTLENATELLEAGANRLVVGHALWENDTVRKNLAEFKELR